MADVYRHGSCGDVTTSDDGDVIGENSDGVVDASAAGVRAIPQTW